MISIFNQDRTEIIYAFRLNLDKHGDKKCIKALLHNGYYAVVGIYEEKEAIRTLKDITWEIEDGSKLYRMPTE